MRSAVTVLLLAAVWAGEAEYLHQRLSRGPEGGDAQKLTSYLEELQKYYTVYGRGRYGKRNDIAVPYKEIPVYQPYPAEDQGRWKLNNDV